MKRFPSYGGDNLDNTCEIIPVEEPSDELADGHTAECAAARKALIRFTAKRKKKEVRAALKEKRMDGKKKSVVNPKPVIMELSPSKQFGTKSAHASHPPKQVICESKESLVDLTNSDEESDDDFVDFDYDLPDSDGEVLSDLISITNDYKPVEEPVIPTDEQEASNSSKQVVNVSEKEEPIPEKNMVTNPFYRDPPMVKLVMSSKRKTVDTHNDSDQPIKKRLRKSVPVEKPSELVRMILAKSKVVGKPHAKVEQPKEVVLEGILDYMRKNGCTQKEFVDVLKEFGLPEVLKFAAGKDPRDQKKLRTSVANVAYRTVKNQAAKCAKLSNPLNDK